MYTDRRWRVCGIYRSPDLVNRSYDSDNLTHILPCLCHITRSVSKMTAGHCHIQCNTVTASEPASGDGDSEVESQAFIMGNVAVEGEAVIAKKPCSLSVCMGQLHVSRCMSPRRHLLCTRWTLF